MNAARARSAWVLVLASFALSLWRVLPAQPPPPRVPERLVEGVAGVLYGRRLDPNRASAIDLEVVPGIGAVRARAIVDHRPYCALRDLERVPGIGPATRRGATPWLEVRSPPRECASLGEGP